MILDTLDIIIEATPLIFAVFFAVNFLLKKGGKIKSHRYLSLFFIAFISIEVFLVFEEFTDKTFGRLLLPFIIGGALIIAPTMYYYANSLIFNTKELNIKKNYSIGIFFFLLNLVVFSSMIFLDKDSSIAKLIANSLNFTTLLPLIILFPIQSIYYIYVSFQSIKKHQLDIGEIYSYEEGINLQWVKVFLSGFICWFILIVLDGFVNYGANAEGNFIGKHVYDFITTGYILFIGLKALQQSAIDKALLASQIIIEDDIKEENTSADENEIEQTKFKEIRDRLEDYMSANQPYVETSLSIYDLAKMIDTNYKYLSKTINLEFNQNFVSYINTYRVEEAMHLLKTSEYDNYTIEALAEMSGFKSKSAFNTAFKKQVGITPSEFKNS